MSRFSCTKGFTENCIKSVIRSQDGRNRGYSIKRRSLIDLKSVNRHFYAYIKPFRLKKPTDNFGRRETLSARVSTHYGASLSRDKNLV